MTPNQLNRGQLTVRVSWSCSSCGAWQTTRTLTVRKWDEAARAYQDMKWTCENCDKAQKELAKKGAQQR